MSPDKTTWTLTRTLRDQVARRAEQDFLRHEDGRSYTYGQTLVEASRVAGGLRQLGVDRGDRVVLMMDNAPELVLAWFGVNLLGAVEVPINTANRGAALVHVLNNCGAAVAVVDEHLLPVVAEVRDQLEHLQVVVTRSGRSDLAGTRAMSWAELCSADALTDHVEVDYREVGAIMYTSGTTGPAKGVLMPQAHMYHFAKQVVQQLRLDEEDTFFVCLPLFHANAQLMQVYATLIAGGTVALVGRFSATEWVAQIRRTGATASSLLGVMAQFIHAQDATPADDDHRLTRMVTIPLPRGIADSFEKRFGVRCVEAYGMTEICLPLYRPIDEPLRPGSCGRVLEDEFEVRVVDPDTDEPLPAGQVGEMVVRPLIPYTTFAGYHQMPERTVEAWRNLWFHTGDSGSYDEDGYFYFADRTHDRIRRRGENITTYDIELALQSFPGVREAAVVAVPADEGEDEIKAFLVTEGTVDRRALVHHCAAQLPYFSVPRFVEEVDELPKTANAKILKRELRDRKPVAEWDRVAAGMRVTKHGVVEQGV
ncbi:AMP-binding protein [Ornithinimicrobium avium]|uniref:ATP-dependent acyl-CoA ligase n=1 Tax=Ornithinimicrobium avium TaxID=2283195 RepID=A0A345NNR2_9MICO|nr:AMP-binding protein [Ornithinimicrobium avium]AXH96670.1 ATP-dependent acyl-CoA ligase [Ornithinimicrobium avium]